jgi:hypothetical protein
MSKETHSQGSNSDDIVKLSLDAYRKAAEYDDYIFGNIDYKKTWIGIKTEGQ